MKPRPVQSLIFSLLIDQSPEMGGEKHNLTQILFLLSTGSMFDDVLVQSLIRK